MSLPAPKEDRARSTSAEATVQAAARLTDSRRTLLRELSRPNSASGLSRRLGLPRQRVNYHLREMEKEGLIELVEERKRGNCIERVVRATSRAYLVNPEVLAALGRTREEIRDRFSAAYLMASAGGAIRELAAVSGRAEKAGKRIATLTLTADLVFASAAGRNRFAEELASEVARLVSKHTGQSPDRVSAAVSQGKGRLFRLLVGLYPALTRNEDGSPIDAPAAAPPETQPETTDQEK